MQNSFIFCAVDKCENVFITLLLPIAFSIDAGQHLFLNSIFMLQIDFYRG